MSRFVRPQTTVLPLSGGSESITVKTRLSAGEQQDAFARMYSAGLDGKLHANPLATGRAMIAAYLVDWNLCDDEGALVPIRGLSPEELDSVLRSLEPESLAEIKGAIEQHEARMAAARAAEKKTHAGSPNGGPISRSPSAADGASNGSAS